jgi:hypothetical protein
MGGAYTLDNIDEEMIPSESSQDAVVAFMINTVVPKTTGFDKYDISQHSYAQPLKEMQIGYLCNNSAMKNGVKNRNSVEKWKNNEAFTFTEIDSSGLGIQMDADHDVELAATMTEFS